MPSYSMKQFYNWSRTFSCRPERFVQPRTEAEIVQLVRDASAAGKTIRVAGAGHSPSDIACTDGWMVQLDNYASVLSVDTAKCRVCVQAGIRLRDLHVELDRHGLAMSNLGSISDQSVAGAISTGTHGTGASFGILATQVVELRLVTAAGDVLTLSRDSETKDTFLAALCSLGSLGIISTVTLQVEPAYNLAAEEFLITFDQLQANWDQLIHSAQLVRFWWFPYTETVLVWRASRTAKPPTPNAHSWFDTRVVGYYLLEYLLYLSSHLPALLPAINRFYAHHNRTLPTKDANSLSVEPFNADSDWCRVDRHDRILNFDCLFRQHVTEWATSADKAPAVLRQLKQALDADNTANNNNNNNGRTMHAHFPVEIRFVRGDDIWLSPANGADLVCYIGIIVYRPFGRDVVPRHDYWRLFERLMSEAGGRPHWAKAFQLGPRELARLYPMFDGFCRLRQKLDPGGLFLNDYTRRHLQPPAKL